MIIGSLASFMNGASLPLYGLIFGDILGVSLYGVALDLHGGQIMITNKKLLCSRASACSKYEKKLH